MAIIAVGFSLSVGLLFVLAVVRKRQRRRTNDVSNSAADEALWTRWLGIAMPMGVLTLLLTATLWLGERQFVRDASLPVVRATASQWAWQFAPVDAGGTAGPATAQLQLIAGQPVIVELVSHDVIHSFWVPRLAGKMDVVPGKVNRHLLQADTPGIYHGLCAEYCGVGHDFMRFEVHVSGAETGQ